MMVLIIGFNKKDSVELEAVCLFRLTPSNQLTQTYTVSDSRAAVRKNICVIRGQSGWNLLLGGIDRESLWLWGGAGEEEKALSEAKPREHNDVRGELLRMASETRSARESREVPSVQCMSGPILSDWFRGSERHC